jgi:aspartyl-tRNA(Asn)/glutamyl-tRNA(Gln) amidotransferase subunit A
MSDTPLHWQPIEVLSKRIHDGSLLPVALMEHFLDRAEALNEALGAFQLLPREQALEAARAAELALSSGHDAGPLHGIPFAAKDIIDVRGLPTTAGSNGLLNNIAERDATVVERLRRAGMVLMGKTRTVQFALGAPGVNRAQGTPHNPWAKEHHVPGGSSSGSAVAVAAGLVPMALGTDTGGSVRMPAGLCGTVGLKPTVRQVSRAGVFPLSDTLDSVGPLTLSVTGAAWVHQALHGVDPRDPMTATASRQDVLSGLEDGAPGLRIALAEGLFLEDQDAEVTAAIEAAAATLSGLGTEVQRIPLPEAAQALAANPRLRISSVEAALAHEERLPNFGFYDDTVAFRLAEGREVSAVDYLRARRASAALAAEAEHALRDIDVFISATTPSVARPLAEVDATEDSYKHWNTRYSRNTVIGNLLNLCAVSVPCGFSADGLPIGLMIHAKAGDEALALRAALAFEAASDWHQRKPDLSHWQAV